MSRMMDELRGRIAKAIQDPGWFVASVMPGKNSPSFSYTIGLTETAHHPECMMIGFRPELMHELLNIVGQHVLAGAKFGDWDSSDKVVADYPVIFRSVPFPEARQWARAASERYRMRGGFSLLQVFLPDENGRFPWDAGADPAMAIQARLLPLMASMLS